MTQLSLTMIHNQVILPGTPPSEFGGASEESFASEWAKTEFKGTEGERQFSANLHPVTPNAAPIEQPDTVADHSDQVKPKVVQADDGNPVALAGDSMEGNVLSTQAATDQSPVGQDRVLNTTSPQNDLHRPQLPTDQTVAVQHSLLDPTYLHLPKQEIAEPSQSPAPQPTGIPDVLSGGIKSEAMTPRGFRIPNPEATQASVLPENPTQNFNTKGLPTSGVAPSESIQTPQQVVSSAMRPVPELILQGFSTQITQGQAVFSQTSLPISTAHVEASKSAHLQAIHPDVERGILETVRSERVPRQPSVRSKEGLNAMQPQIAEQLPVFGEHVTSGTEFRQADKPEVLRYETQGSVKHAGATAATTLSPAVFFGAPTNSHDLSAPVGQLSSLPILDVDSKAVVTTTSQQAKPLKPELAQVVIRQLAGVVPQVSDRPVEVFLNPEELGRVRLVMLGQDSQMVVQIHADKPETSDLIRRHLDMLAQDFQELGYSDISFSFSNQGENNEQSQDETSPDTSLTVQPTDIPTAPQLLLPQSGLDLRL